MIKNIYLILLLVLLLFTLVFWVLVVWFRILFECELGKCCGGGSELEDEDETSSGRRNLGFTDNDDLYNNRPNTITERMESPPSYEEALKYDQFGFHVSPPVHVASSVAPSSSSSARSDATHENPPALSRERTSQLSENPPRATDVRTRCGNSSMLTPIREEEVEEMPITVVIDCIGVQASRLLENCDSKIDISDGENLNSDSKC